MTTLPSPECHLVEPLTPAEETVLQLLAQGLSDKEIGIKLSIAPITVRGDHKQNLYDKLGLPPGYRNRKWAVHCARQLGLVAGGDNEQTLEPPGDNPYRGLDAFQPDDAPVFFGREMFVERLLTHLGRNGSAPRFLALVGPSGSGKSSVIGAGLIPTLTQSRIRGGNRWTVTTMSPRHNPFFELETALRAVAVKQQPDLLDLLERDSYGLARVARLILPEERPLLLLIDQFEENFTLVEDSALARRFMDLIYAAVTDPRSTVWVVITLRADFLDRPLMYPDFSWLVQEHTSMVVPLTPDKLERAITLPAQHARVTIEPGLVARLVAEAHEQPGALPLLEFALTELYDNRIGRTISMKTYDEIGGLQRALAAHADRVFAGLDDLQQAAARQLFLRLITLGEGTEDVRRRVSTQELESLDMPSDAMDHVIHFLAANRLLILSLDPATRQPLVEVAHEALIREWVQLRVWLDESRADVRMERLLALAVDDWEHHGCAQDYLLQGAKLAQFEGWRMTTDLSLTTAEHAFLDASIAERDRQAAAERDRQMREKRLERRSQTFLRGLVAVLLVAMLGAFGLSATALNQGRIAQAERERAKQQARVAQARELVGYASDTLDSDAELSTLLALHAVNRTYTIDGTVLPEANTVLHQAVQSLNPPRRIAVGTFPEGNTATLAFTADGTRIVHPLEYATGTNSGLTGVSDVATGQLFYTVTGEVLTVVSRDNRIITVDGSPGAERFLYWDVSSYQGGELLNSSPIEQTLDTWIWADVSTDFRVSLIVDTAETTRLWDLTSGQEITSTANPIFPSNFGNPWFSRDGDHLANRNPDGTVSILDTTTWQEIARLAPSGTGVSNFRFSPDGQMIITANRDNTVTVWETRTGSELYSISLRIPPAFMSLSQDGTRLAVATVSGQVKIFESESQQEQLSLSVSKVDDIILNPDGSRLVTWHNRGQIRIWDLIPGQELPALVNEDVPDGGPVGLAYSPDGKQILVASMSNTPAVWDIQAGRQVFTLSDHRARVLAAAWSADGEFLATAGDDTDVRLWDAASGETVLTLSGHSDSIYGLAFSPDSGRLASSSYDQTVRIWDVVTGELLLTLDQPAQSKGVAWSPDGLRVAASTDVATDRNGHVRVWDAISGELQLDIPVGNTRTGIVAFNLAGSRIVVGMQEAHVAQVFDAQSGEALQTFTGHVANAGGVAYSPDGSRIATSGNNEDRTIRLWDAASGQALLTLHTASGVGRVAFSPDGKLLASQHHDGTTRLYVLPIPDLVTLAQSRLTRSLTDAECQRYLHVETCPATP